MTLRLRRRGRARTDAVEHLARLGRRRIVHVTGPESFLVGARARRRLPGRSPAPRSRRPARLVVRSLGPRGGRPPLVDAPEPPDGIFCGNDQIARGVVDALRERGRRRAGRRLGRRLRQLGDRRGADAPAADHGRHEPQGTRPAGRAALVRASSTARPSSPGVLEAAVQPGGPGVVRGQPRASQGDRQQAGIREETTMKTLTARSHGVLPRSASRRRRAGGRGRRRCGSRTGIGDFMPSSSRPSTPAHDDRSS